MGDYSKCKWCGKTFEKSGWNQFKSGYTLGIAGKEAYCSKRCETEATGGASANQSHVSAAQTVVPQPVYQERPKTEAEIAYEIERKRKEDEIRDEQSRNAQSRKEAKIAYEIERKRKEDEISYEQIRRAQSRKEEKIRKYEQEGKKFLLFITEKPILASVLFFVVFPVVVFFVTAIISKNGPAALIVASLPMLLFLGLYLKDSMKK